VFYVARPSRSIPVSAIRFPQLLELAPNSELVLLIADFFHLIDRFAVQCFLNGDMNHHGRHAVPIFFMGTNVPLDYASLLLSKRRLTTAGN